MMTFFSFMFLVHLWICFSARLGPTRTKVETGNSPGFCDISLYLPVLVGMTGTPDDLYPHGIGTLAGRPTGTTSRSPQRLFGGSTYAPRPFEK